MTDAVLSTLTDKIQIDDVHGMLSNAYWSPGITKEEIRKGISNSALVVGAFLGSGRQVGFARVISDKVRFAYICDVIVHEEFRKQGICRNMVNHLLSHPELKDVYQWLLVTKDAHGVYSGCGFKPLRNPQFFMASMHPRPDRSDFKS